MQREGDKGMGREMIVPSIVLLLCVFVFVSSQGRKMMMMVRREGAYGWAANAALKGCCVLMCLCLYTDV